MAGGRLRLLIRPSSVNRLEIFNSRPGQRPVASFGMRRSDADDLQTGLSRGAGISLPMATQYKQRHSALRSAGDME